jgi:hypothetical protein
MRPRGTVDCDLRQGNPGEEKGEREKKEKGQMLGNFDVFLLE